MPRRNLSDLFMHFFPQFGEKATVWFSNGPNSIRVKLVTEQELIFTYNGPKDWTVETADSYLGKTKGDK